MSLKYWSFRASGHLPGLGFYNGSACGEFGPALVSPPQPAVTADVRKRFRAKSFAGRIETEREAG